MLLPKRVKYRRQHRGRMRGEAHKGNFVAYGEFGLQAQEASWITSRQRKSSLPSAAARRSTSGCVPCSIRATRC